MVGKWKSGEFPTGIYEVKEVGKWALCTNTRILRYVKRKNEVCHSHHHVHDEGCCVAVVPSKSSSSSSSSVGLNGSERRGGGGRKEAWIAGWEKDGEGGSRLLRR